MVWRNSTFPKPKGHLSHFKTKQWTCFGFWIFRKRKKKISVARWWFIVFNVLLHWSFSSLVILAVFQFGLPHFWHPRKKSYFCFEGNKSIQQFVKIAKAAKLDEPLSFRKQWDSAFAVVFSFSSFVTRSAFTDCVIQRWVESNKARINILSYCNYIILFSTAPLRFFVSWPNLVDSLKWTELVRKEQLQSKEDLVRKVAGLKLSARVDCYGISN